MDRTIHVEAHVTWNDLYSYLLYMSYAKITGVLEVVFSLACLCLAVITFGKYGAGMTAFLILLGVWFTLYQPAILLMKAKKQAKNAIFSKPTSYEFDKKGFQISQGEAKVTVIWDQLYRVIGTGKAVYLMSSPVQGNIIPRTAENHCDEIMKLAAENMMSGCVKGK